VFVANDGCRGWSLWVNLGLCVWWCCLWGLCVLEEFVARVFKDGKVTVPKHVRDLWGVVDGDYVRLVLVEVLKRGEGGEWVRRKVT
jgi:hypothetical protein